MGGASDGVGAALAQTGHEHVARAGRHREQGVIAPDVGVAVVEGALLLEPVRLADRRVEVDRERCGTGARTGSPGPGEEVAADGVELADMAPAEAAQERAQGRWRLDPMTEDPARPARSQRVGVVDAVAAGERRHDERQELVADVRSAGLVAEVEVGLDEILHAEVVGQGGRQEEARVGDEAVVVEGGFQSVEAVRRSHLSGVLLGGSVLS